MTSNNRAGALAAIEAELHAERAASLSRVSTRLEQVLQELLALEAELGLLDGPARRKRERLHEEARREAARQLWNLIVQREAMGLYRHDDVYELYGVPHSLVPSPL